jgi:hypothetical protein
MPAKMNEAKIVSAQTPDITLRRRRGRKSNIAEGSFTEADTHAGALPSGDLGGAVPAPR